MLDEDPVEQRAQERRGNHRTIVMSLELDADEVVRVASGLRCLAHYIRRNDASESSDLVALDQIEGLLRRLAPVEDALVDRDDAPRRPTGPTKPERPRFT